MPRRPTNIQTYLLKEKERQLKFNPGTIEEQRTGFGNTPTLEAIPKPNIAKNERVIAGETNAFIYFGKDKPGGKDTGWGAEGRKSGAARIDLVAGLSGVTAKEANPLGEAVATSPNPSLDSARIYITQQAKDIDSEEYFSLADGKVGKVMNESAIVVKADSVRLVGRKGIKIVTGSDKYSGGSGFWVGDDIPGIDLIAGNNDSNLQPMVKGEDLRQAILAMEELRYELFEFITFILKLQLKHLSITLPNPYMASAIPTLIQHLGKDGTQMVLKMASHAVKTGFFKWNMNAHPTYPNPAPAYDFRSKHNNVN